MRAFITQNPKLTENNKTSLPHPTFISSMRLEIFHKQQPRRLTEHLRELGCKEEIS
jgi:hypothetical protein